MRTYHFPYPLDHEHRLVRFGAETSEPQNVEQEMQEAEKLMDADPVGNSEDAEGRANDAKAKTESDLAQMKKDVPDPVTYEVSFEGGDDESAEEVAQAEEDLAKAIEAPDREWSDGSTTSSHEDIREDADQQAEKRNQPEGDVGYGSSETGKADVPAGGSMDKKPSGSIPADAPDNFKYGIDADANEGAAGDKGKEGSKGTDGKKPEDDMKNDPETNPSSGLPQGRSEAETGPGSGEDEDPKKTETTPPKTETAPPKPSDSNSGANNDPETNPGSGLPQGKSEAETGPGSGEDEDPKKAETTPPKTEDEPPKGAGEQSEGNGKTPEKGKGENEQNEGDSKEKEKSNPNETNRQRIDRQMKEAQDVLTNDKATGEQRFEAALRVASLMLERMFGSINGTLDQKADTADTESDNEKKDDKTEKNEDSTAEKPNEKGTETDDKVRESRLKDELKDSESGDKLIADKQTKLDEKVDKTHSEMNEIDTEVDQYDAEIKTSENDKNLLEDQKRDAKQELDALDTKGKKDDASNARRDVLKESIRELDRKIADATTDIEAKQKKIDARKEERAKLESDLNSDKEVVDLREDIRVLKGMKERGEKEAKSMNETLKPALKEFAKNIEGLSDTSMKVEVDPKTFGLRITVEGGVVDMLKETLKDSKVDFAKAIDAEGVVTDLKAMMEIFKTAAIEKGKSKEK